MVMGGDGDPLQALFQGSACLDPLPWVGPGAASRDWGKKDTNPEEPTSWARGEGGEGEGAPRSSRCSQINITHTATSAALHHPRARPCLLPTALVEERELVYFRAGPDVSKSDEQARRQAKQSRPRSRNPPSHSPSTFASMHAHPFIHPSTNPAIHPFIGSPK